jgi:sodium/hydrogen antiporter
MWSGPKGFASVVCGLFVLHGGIPAADEIFHLVALTITLSIIAHSSTDVLVARLFDDEREMPTWYSSIRRRVRARPNDRQGVVAQARFVAPRDLGFPSARV